MLVYLLLLYPLLSHVTVMTGSPHVAAYYLLLIALLFLIKELYSRKYTIAFILAVVLVFIGWLLAVEKYVLLMYIPPVAISLGLLLLFGRSLQPGSVPLITRYARYIDGDLDEKLLRYTRRVTRVWTVFFLLMLIETVALAIWASVETWSLFTNVLNYVAIVVLLFIEVVYRYRAYPDAPRRSFVQHVKAIASIRPAQLEVKE